MTKEQKQESAAITAGESMKEHAVRFAQWLGPARQRAMKFIKPPNKTDAMVIINRTFAEWYDLWPERNQSPESLPAERGDGKEIIEVLNWLLKQSSDKKIVMVDGDFYFSDDDDGDKPLDGNDIFHLFKGRPLTEKPAENKINKNIQKLEMELQEWKQIALDALSGNEMLVFSAWVKANFDEVLEDLEAVKQVLTLCDGKPCVETMDDIIKRIKKGLRK